MKESGRAILIFFKKLNKKLNCKKLKDLGPEEKLNYARGNRSNKWGYIEVNVPKAILRFHPARGKWFQQMGL